MKLRSWLNPSSNKSRKKRSRRRNQRRLRMETLETRDLLTTIVVDSLGDDLIADGAVTLREALEAANTDSAVGDAAAGSGADTIEFAPGLTGTIALTQGELEFTDSVAIHGPGADTLTIEGNDNFEATFRIYDFGLDVELSGLSVTDGSDAAFAVEQGVGSSFTLRDSVVTAENDFGVGINNFQGGDALIENVTISAESTGLVVIAFGPSSTVTVRGTTISDSDSGIALIGFGLSDGALTVENSTLSGNTQGGIITLTQPYPGYSSSNAISIRNSTITGNAFGVGNGGGLDPDTIRLENSIVAGNSDSDLLSLGGNPLTTVTASHTLIGDGTGSGFAEAPVGSPDANGNLIGGATNGVIDPLLDVLADNGGPTQTHALLPGSPAIDMGDAAFTSPPDFDQRGAGFDRVVNGRVDIGAFEVQVSSPEDVLAGVLDSIQDLLDSGTVNGGQANALISKIENALASLDKDNAGAAANKLSALKNQINAFLSSGVLTQAEADPLLDDICLAIDLINEL